MRFKRWPRVEAYQETSRTRAAVALSQLRQRDRLPLLAELIAAEQPSIEAVIEERHQAWPKWQQEKRDDRAWKWREACRQLAAYPLITRDARVQSCVHKCSISLRTGRTYAHRSGFHS